VCTNLMTRWLICAMHTCTTTYTYIHTYMESIQRFSRNKHRTHTYIHTYIHTSILASNTHTCLSGIKKNQKKSIEKMLSSFNPMLVQIKTVLKHKNAKLTDQLCIVRHDRPQVVWFLYGGSHRVNQTV